MMVMGRHRIILFIGGNFKSIFMFPKRYTISLFKVQMLSLQKCESQMNEIQIRKETTLIFSYIHYAKIFFIVLGLKS